MTLRSLWSWTVDVMRSGGAGAELAPAGAPHRVPTVEGLTYDPGAAGGTSTLVVDAQGRRVSQHTSLAGTVNNCAGGVTPWGTWLSCEETSARAGFDPGRGALRELPESEGGEVAGRLQAMQCLEGGAVVPDLSEATSVGTRYDVRWIDVPDRDGRSESVRRQSTDDGITRAHELEGQWWGDDGAYFVSSYADVPDEPVT